MFRQLSTVLLTVLFSCLSLVSQASVLDTLPSDSKVRLFAIHGSNTIGEELAPNLLQKWFRDAGLSQVRIEPTGVENERLISGRHEKLRTRVEVLVAAHGSGTGYRSLLDGSGDIAASSRPIKDKEYDLLKPVADMRSIATEHVVAIDGLAVIVHPDNPISELSVDQIAAIFSGAVQDWSELGGFRGAIHLHARDDKSGTWDSFKSMVLDDQPLAANALRYESTAELSDAVAAQPGAIGFVGLSSVRSAKAIAVYDGTSRAMLPNKLTVATEDYALARRLFLYTRAQVKPAVEEFIQFALADAGQQIVADTGFVSQEVMAVMPEFYHELPQEFRQLTEDAQRLTLNFRFEQGSARLDNKGLKDLQRLVRYLEAQPQAELVLVGFGDPKKTEKRSQLLSKLRAMSVRRELVREGIYPQASVGFGDDLLVASVEGEDGRLKNRRVEVWVRSANTTVTPDRTPPGLNNLAGAE